jgi:hypothetical protein
VTPLGGLSDPLTGLGRDSFISADGSSAISLQVNPQGKYNSLNVILKSTAKGYQIAPANDQFAALSIDSRGTSNFTFPGITPTSWVIGGGSTLITYTLGSEFILEASPPYGIATLTNFNRLFGLPSNSVFSINTRVILGSGSSDMGVRYLWSNGETVLGLGFKEVGAETLLYIFEADGTTEYLLAYVNITDFDTAHTYTLQSDYTTINILIDGIKVSDILKSRLHKFPTTPYFQISLSTNSTYPNSSIALGSVSITLDKDEHYLLPTSQVGSTFFYLNAPEESKVGILNTTPLFTGALFDESVPKYQLSNKSAEVYSGSLDSVDPLLVTLTYPWGGERTNDPASTMQRSLITGFLLNDFTAGYSTHPYTP